MAAEAVVLPLVIKAGFGMLGVPRTQAILRRWARCGRRADPDTQAATIAAAGRVQRIVKRSTGLGGTCLMRSLALWAILMRRGVTTDIRIGVRKIGGVAEGHAWLEHLGKPINEDEDVTSTYVLFERQIAFDAWRSLK